MARRPRQLDELRALCRPGEAAVARAIDLAFQHFAEFGYDDDVVNLIIEAVRQVDAASDVGRRLDELRASKP